jgi:hypothetical protein
MANKRQLGKMGQTARKADVNPNASKKAIAVSKKTTSTVNKALATGSFAFKAKPSDENGRVVKGQLGKKANAIVNGRISQVKKEAK